MHKLVKQQKWILELMVALVPKWKTLKSLSNSPLARLTIIVPVVGWVLLYNDTLVALITNITGSAPAANDLWKLYIFYVGLTFIAVSAILFVIFCPRIISRFSDINDYTSVEKKIFTPEMEAKTSRSLDLQPMKWEDPADTFKKINGLFSLARIHDANEEKIYNRMRLIYNAENSQNILMRILTIFFFLTGAILTSMPALHTLIWCIQSIYTLWCSSGHTIFCVASG